MIFRLSQKLAKKIKAGPLKPMPLDENPRNQGISSQNAISVELAR